MKVFNLVGCIVAAAIVLQATSSWAGVIAYDGLTGISSNQGVGGAGQQAIGANSSNGSDFDVLAAAGIRVTHIGAWDELGDGLVGGTTGSNTGEFHTAIFDRTSGSIVPGTDTMWNAGNFAAQSGFFQSDNQLIPITPVVLPPGQYAIVAESGTGQHNSFNAGFANFPDTNDGGGLIAFVGSSRWDNDNVFNLPGIEQGATAMGTFPAPYHAGTFMFEAIPEPATATLALASLVMLGLGASRRRS